MDFAELTAYQRNAWPAMVADLASDLGVSARSLTAIGIGWMPNEACWVFPERDAEGRVVGLVRRFKNGKKLSTEGSKRGLTYALAADFQEQSGSTYVPGSHNWTRCSDEFPCPICGKTDWCLLSSDDPTDPKAVICGRTPEGATQPLGDAGYLHIRKPAGKVHHSPLPDSTLSTLIVEGQSDVCAAYDLGFTAVGRPSAAGGLSYLCDLLVGSDAVVMGENDAGTGRLGMEKTFETLKPKVKGIAKLMPPEGIKDLRAWVRSGLTRETLKQEIEARGDIESSDTLLESTAPLDLADRWLHDRHWLVGLPIIRMYSGNWYRFDGKTYTKIDEKSYLRGDIYTFLKGKMCKKATKDGVNIVPFEANISEVTNMIDALSMTCPVYEDAPCWLDEENHPRTMDMISFTNGLIVLPDLEPIEATPRFFSMTSMPYEWHANSTCKRWLKFLSEIFPNDPQKIALLQEWFGYNLVVDTSQEKLMFLVGRPGAGKGTVLEALRAVLGSDQVASTSFDTLVSDFGLQPLLGKLAAILADAHITRRGDPAKALQILKEISGQDGVGVNRKNKEFLSDHKLTCRFTISVNSMPDLPDHERSLDRRLLLLHFGECFSGREDTHLKDKIAEEAPGIAVWAVQGLLRLRAAGFTSPTSSKPVIEEFRKQSSPISEFVDEFCEIGRNCTIPGNMLYDAYARWCKDQGALTGTSIRFSQRLLLLYPGVRADRFSFNGKQVRGFIGLKLTDEAVERYLIGRR
jgi:putative DNA primase/helicase